MILPFLQARDDAAAAAAAAQPRVKSIVTTGLVVVSVIFPALSLCAIYLRYLARRKSRQSLHADDAWIVASWIFALALSMLAWVFTAKIGVNYFKPDLDVGKGTVYSVQLIWLSSCIVQLPLFAVKTSILLFYKRIFSTRAFRICVWIAVAVVAIWGLLFFFLVLFQSWPLRNIWTGGPLFFDSPSLGFAQVGSSIALDLVVLCFPLPVISSLQMRSKRKVSLVFIFWLGAFCCIAAAIRLYYLDKSIRAVVKEENTVFLESKQFIFMIIEPNCSIIAACLPCYGPLIAGGRSAESLVQSVRSVFSLRSIRSQGSNNSRATAPKANPDTGSSSQPDKASIADSQIELSTQKWSNWTGEQNVQVVAGDSNLSPSRSIHKKGISVTNGVTVTTD